MSYEADSGLIFYRLESLEGQVREMTRKEGEHKAREEKLREDLNVAHGRIRDLMGENRTANIKVWIAGGAAGGLMTLCGLLLKALLHV